MKFNVLKYQPVIVDVLRRFKIPQSQREDLSQECYLALLEKQAEFGSHLRDEYSFAAVLCRNHIINHLKATKREADKTEPLDLPKIKRKAEKVRDPSAVEPNFELLDAIDALPEAERRALRGYYVDGKTRKKVAEDAGVNKSTITRRIRSGVDKLKKFYGEE